MALACMFTSWGEIKVDSHTESMLMLMNRVQQSLRMKKERASII